MNNCSIWDSTTLKQVAHCHLHTYLKSFMNLNDCLLVSHLERCFFSCDIPNKQISKARFQSSQNVSLTDNNSRAQNSLASHIAPCFTVRNMSSQMNDYPTLQYTTDLYCSKGARGRRRRRRRRSKKKEKWNKVEWCQLLCHLSLSWLCSWYVETTFLRSGGDNPRLFPFTSPW